MLITNYEISFSLLFTIITFIVFWQKSIARVSKVARGYINLSVRWKFILDLKLEQCQEFEWDPIYRVPPMKRALSD